MSAAIDQLEKTFETYVDQLKELAKIPSCSWEGFDPKFVVQSAEKTAELLKKAGLEHVEILKVGDAHPYVYADWLHAGDDKPTVLLYAHHDVQPPMRDELWKTLAYEPTQVGDRLFGRGVADDKAGILIHFASIDCLLKTEKKLPVNVKVIIEGEEEIGSSHLMDFLAIYKTKMQSDVMILTDLSNYDTGIPSLTTSLRGLVTLEIELKTMDHPLHSGMYGGPIPDPSVALSKIISGLVDDNGKVAIPELHEKVKLVSDLERKMYKSLNMTRELFRKQATLLPETDILGDNEEILIKMWREPSLVINSMESGSRKSAGNVIMDSAWAKIGLRIVPNIDRDFAIEVLKKKILSLVKWNVSITFKEDIRGAYWTTDIDHPYFEVAKNALSKGYNAETVFMGSGGSIPFAGPFSDALGGIPALMVGVEDPYTNAHSENESLHLGDFKKAIRGQIYLFEDLGKMGKVK